MARTVDLNSAIRELVAASVKETLAPYLETLERLGVFMGGTRRRGPGRPPKATRGSTRATANRGDATKFSVGQPVSYKQGRGQFDAKVVKIDSNTNTVTVERAKDRKRVERPASKIMAA